MKHKKPSKTEEQTPTRNEPIRSKHLPLLLFAFGTGLFILSGLTRLFLSSVHVGSRFYLADLIDIIVVAPFSIFVLVELKWKLMKGLGAEKGASLYKNINRMFYLSLFLFVEGHGIHFVGNSLDLYLADGGITSGGIHDFVYLFDEILGHIIMYSGLFGMLMCLLALDVRNPMCRKMSRNGRTLAAVGALLFGIMTAMGLIEGQLPIPGLTMMIGVAGYLLVVGGQKTQRPRFDVSRSPVQFFLVTAFLVAIITMAVYAVVYGGFPQLSEVGGLIFE